MSDRIHALEEALTWALDLLDMYDEHTIEIGDAPPEVVYSQVHLAGKAKARAALTHTAPSGDLEKEIEAKEKDLVGQAQVFNVEQTL